MLEYRKMAAMRRSVAILTTDGVLSFMPAMLSRLQQPCKAFDITAVSQLETKYKKTKPTPTR